MITELKNVEWKINVERFSEFSFIKDEIDLLIINNVIDKTYVNINDLFEYVDLFSKTKVSLKKVKNRFEYLIGELKFTTMWRGLNYPDETKVKDLYLIRQNEDSWKQKYLKINKMMKDETIKKMNEFGSLIYDVLWTEKSKNKKVLKKLKDLINSKTKFDFTKEEFINAFFFDDCLFPFKPREQYNNLDDFILTFFEDTYDAVVMENDFTVMILLEERIADFDLLNEKYNGINNSN